MRCRQLARLVREVLHAAAMRALILMLLVACADHGAGGAMPICGDACETCFKPNSFSSCEGEVCTCTGGKLACTPLAPSEGESCLNAPITSCSFEGTLSCDTPPTSQFCGCNADRTWHCTCACYGGLSNTCNSGCPTRFADAENAMCAAPLDCTFPEGTCHCAGGHFTCSPP